MGRSLQQTRLVRGRSYKCCAGSKADKYSNNRVGATLRRDTPTISRWLQQYRRGGLSELLEEKPEGRDGGCWLNCKLDCRKRTGSKVIERFSSGLSKPLVSRWNTRQYTRRCAIDSGEAQSAPTSLSQAEPAGSECLKTSLALLRLQNLFAGNDYVISVKMKPGLDSRVRRASHHRRGIKPIAPSAVATRAIAWWNRWWMAFSTSMPISMSEHFQSFLMPFPIVKRTWAFIQLEQPKPIKPSLHWPENLIPVLQPPTQLNPIERLWQFSNRSCRGELWKFDSVTAATSAEFQQLTPEQVASLTSYDFILALFYAAA